jgi:hypothetical protein
MGADVTEDEGPGLAGTFSRAGLELRESAGEQGQAEYVVLGNTYANKDILRDHGGRWSRRRQGWVFTSLERLRELAGVLPAEGQAAAAPGLADAPAVYAGAERPQQRREKKRYHGHRERLRTRFMEAGPATLPDYELLELLLFFSIEVRDTKDLAKDLLKEFGSLGGVLNADPERLREMPGLPAPASEYLEWLRYWRSPHHEAEARPRRGVRSWPRMRAAFAPIRARPNGSARAIATGPGASRRSCFGPCASSPSAWAASRSRTGR